MLRLFTLYISTLSQLSHILFNHLHQTSHFLFLFFFLSLLFSPSFLSPRPSRPPPLLSVSLCRPAAASLAPSLAARRRIHGGAAAHGVSGHASSLVSRGLGPPPPPMAARRAGGSRRPACRAPEERPRRSGQGGGPRPRPLPCSSSQIRPRRDPWLRRRTRGTCTSSSSAASAASPGSGWRRLSSQPLLPCRAASLLSTAPPSLPRGATATTSARQLVAELQRLATCGGAAGAPRCMQRRGGAGDDWRGSRHRRPDPSGASVPAPLLLCARAAASSSRGGGGRRPWRTRGEAGRGGQRWARGGAEHTPGGGPAPRRRMESARYCARNREPGRQRQDSAHFTVCRCSGKMGKSNCMQPPWRIPCGMQSPSAGSLTM